MHFKVGDIVRLKSGGPHMTVDYVVGSNAIIGQDELLYEEGLEDGDVICQWFTGTAITGKGFKASTIAKVSIKSSGQQTG